MPKVVDFFGCFYLIHVMRFVISDGNSQTRFNHINKTLSQSWPLMAPDSVLLKSMVRPELVFH